MPAAALSAEGWSRSTSVTSSPAVSAAAAMPCPMVPPPMMPTRSSLRGLTPVRSPCCAARRSAKKAWISAARSGVCIKSMKARRSCATPPAKGIASPSTMVSSARIGATCPRADFMTFRRHSSTIAASAAGASASPKRRGPAPWFSSRRASASPAARESVPLATASISPSRRASPASIWRPEVMRSIAASVPTARGSRCVPPAPGKRPKVTSGRPIRVPGTATR